MKKISKQTGDGNDALLCANALYHNEDYSEAIDYYKMGMDNSEKSNAWIEYNIACCYGKLKDKENALYWFERSIDSGFAYLLHAVEDDDLKIISKTDKFKELTHQHDVEGMSRDEGWRLDLDCLLMMIERISYSPYLRYSKDEFMKFIDNLKRKIPQLSDLQVTAEFIKLVAMVGDGHSAIDISDIDYINDYQLPLDLYHLENEVFIIGSTPDYANILGAKLIAINSVKIKYLFEELQHVVSYDNEWGKKEVMTHYLRFPILLYGLDLIKSKEEIIITFEQPDGNIKDVKIDKFLSGSYKEYFLNNSDACFIVPENTEFWYRRSENYYYYIDDNTGIVYCQFNSIQSDDDLSFDDFTTQLFQTVNSKETEALILDLRWNGGGNTNILPSFLHQLISSKVNVKGKLFVFTSPKTFSAAMNLVTFIDFHTEATFIGEPTGSSPNFIGETVLNRLPYSNLLLSLSDIYWQSSWPFDFRKCINPDIYAPQKLEELENGIDIAYEIVKELV